MPLGKRVDAPREALLSKTAPAPDQDRSIMPRDVGDLGIHLAGQRGNAGLRRQARAAIGTEDLRETPEEGGWRWSSSARDRAMTPAPGRTAVPTPMPVSPTALSWSPATARNGIMLPWKPTGAFTRTGKSCRWTSGPSRRAAAASTAFPGNSPSPEAAAFSSAHVGPGSQARPRA